MNFETRRDPFDFLPLNINWFHILVSLAEGPRHGYAVMQDVGARTGGKVRLWPATLYGAMRLLSEEHLIEKAEDAASRDEDPRRRYYRITRLGEQVLAAEGRRLQAMADMTRVVRSERGVS